MCVCARTIFINSLVDGHLVGFHILPVVNDAAMNREYRYLFGMLNAFPLDKHPMVGSSDPIFNVLRKLRAVFHTAVLAYLPKGTVQGFPLSASSPASAISSLFDNSHVISSLFDNSMEWEHHGTVGLARPGTPLAQGAWCSVPSRPREGWINESVKWLINGKSEV